MTDAPRPRQALRCPICRRVAAEATRPFCSERCAQADLGRWLTESYAIPAGPAEETED